MRVSLRLKMGWGELSFKRSFLRPKEIEKERPSAIPLIENLSTRAAQSVEKR